MNPNYLGMAEIAHGEGWDREMWLCLLWWVDSHPIYSCDDLGLCNGPNEKHDCVDCPKKRW